MEVQRPIGVTFSDGTKPAVSVEKTGSHVNYYLVDVAQPKRLQPYKAECEDIIEALGMTFAEGCQFKALWRSCAARNLGLHKEGQDADGIYDAEKGVYYAVRVLATRERRKQSRSQQTHTRTKNES